MASIFNVLPILTFIPPSLIVFHVTMMAAMASSLRLVIEPGREECFYTDVEKDKTLKIDYAVLSATQGELDIDFVLSGPPKQPLIIESRKSSSNIRYPVAISGSYRVCFSNTFSHFSKKTVSFSTKMEKNELDSIWSSYDVNLLVKEADKNVKIEDFHEKTDKVRKLLNSVSEIQEEFRQLESRDRGTAEHNFERVNFWSTVYLAVLISVGIIQVLLVKGFFDEKYAIGRFFQRLLGDP